MPESEKSEEHLTQDAQVILAAGSVTTARTVGIASYYILSQPGLLQNLQNELKDVMAGWPEHIPSWAELERVPLLNAIIKETLRYVFELVSKDSPSHD
jgi:cytochrome P450